MDARWPILGLMLVARPVLGFLAALPLLGACASGVSGNDGDCNARIRYEGVIYQPHNALNETARRVRSSAPAMSSVAMKELPRPRSTR